MNLLMYSVYDKAVKAFLQPFFVRSKGEAIRSFADAVNKKDHQFGLHVMDFVLFEIGEYDDTTAGISVPASPVKVIEAHEVQSKE